MKRIVIVLLLLVSFTYISNAQAIRHVKNTKTIGIFYTPTVYESTFYGNVIQPYFAYFITSNLSAGLRFSWGNYDDYINEKRNTDLFSVTKSGSGWIIKPTVAYSFFKIKNIVYFNASAGLNIGSQTLETTDYNRSTRVIKPTVTTESGIQVGPDLGLTAEVFVFKGLSINVGGDFNVLTERLFGKNTIQLLGGLAYNF
jgi:hypothetical protein